MSLPTATKLVTGVIRLRLAAISLDTLPVRPLGPHAAPAVAGATGHLLHACQQAHDWYLSFAAAVAGARFAVPPVSDVHPALHGELLGALDSAIVARDPAAMRLALRLLWAEENLHDEYALRNELSRDAQALMQQARRRHLI